MLGHVAVILIESPLTLIVSCMETFDLTWSHLWEFLAPRTVNCKIQCGNHECPIATIQNVATIFTPNLLYFIDMRPSISSKILTRTELFISGSEIIIRCEFADKYPDASCVLVYKEHNDPYLTVKEYTHILTEFPVTVPVENPEKYTFAVFGRNGIDEIEVEPVIILRTEDHVTFPEPEACTSPKICKYWHSRIRVMLNTQFTAL